MKHLTKAALVIFLSGTLSAQTTAITPEEAPADNGTSDLAKLTEKEAETSQLAAENALYDEQHKKNIADLKATVEKLKLEKEAILEELALETAQLQKSEQVDELAFSKQLKQLNREADVAKAKADKAVHDLKLKKAEWDLETAKLEAEIKALEVGKQRDAFANNTPIFLEDPLQDDGTLVISDRRIELNGPVTYETADHITARINYFNNKDNQNPIFIVIDASPGGSVMAGYRILKAMEGSSAPVYVVVKSFAASMAATICTLAERSFAYPNAILLHHQISSTLYFANLNLTEQREFYEESQEWWKRLAIPIAKKMGITTDEFIAQMYDKASSGDWMEFGDEAKKLKWVDNVVTRIHETSLLKNPDVDTNQPKAFHGLVETLDEDGNPCIYLPRLVPKDCYFLYDKGNYYRMK